MVFKVARLGEVGKIVALCSCAGMLCSIAVGGEEIEDVRRRGEK